MGRGFFLGIFSGIFVSGIAVATASLMAPQPAGNTPPARPQVEAPAAASGDVAPSTAPATVEAMEDGPTLGVAPTVDTPSADTAAPMADTTPADVPQTGVLDADLGTPESGGETPLVDLDSSVEPVLPSPQSIAPAVPQTEADITLSTEPAQPVAPVVVDDTAFDERDAEVVTEPASGAEPDADQSDAGEPDSEQPVAAESSDAGQPADPALEPEEFVIIDLGDDTPVIREDGVETGETFAPEPAPTFQLQGDTAALPTVEGSGVIIRRPGAAQTEEVSQEQPTQIAPALERFAAVHDNPEGKPLLSVVLIDDDMMPGASAALAGLPFNQALREAERAQVPAAVIYRDLDSEDQDAQVIRRFLDQAAFQARKESGVVLLGRLRPNTISALILWGTANRAGQVSVAPASAVLMAQ